MSTSSVRLALVAPAHPAFVCRWLSPADAASYTPVFGFVLVAEADLPAGWQPLPPPEPTPEQQVKAFKDALLADFAALPLQVRAVFRSVKTQVLDCINDGAYDEAVYLITHVVVPPELEPVRAALLTKFAAA